MARLRLRRHVGSACAVALAALLGACDADSPTEPTQTPNAPIPTTATTGFAISVGLSPNSVVLGDGTTVQVSVIARRTDTNELMRQGSTALLSTTNGILTNEAGTGTGTTVTLTFGLNGTALATLTGVAEDAVVRAQIEQSTGQATLRVAPVPEVTPFSLLQATPNFGPPTGGTEVRIEGTGFSQPTEVVFGGVAVPVLSVSSSVIRVLSPQIDLPSGTNRAVSISVAVNVGEEDAASGTLGSGFTYTRNTTPVIPKIISVTPTSGPNEGGTRVTIFGEAFGPEVQVFFGDASRIEAPVLDVTPTRILVETPSATGQNSDAQNSVVSVRVRDLRSGFEASLSSAFQYGGGDMIITAISPGTGLYLGGTQVTIFSTGGFEAPVAVSFGGAAQQVVSVSGTEIVARSVPVQVGCGGQSGAVSVVNIETGESFSGPSFTYETITPQIGGVSPASTTIDTDTGAIVFGSATTASISGSGFDRQANPPIVAFGVGCTNGTGTSCQPAGGVSITSIDGNPLYEGYGIGDEMSFSIPAFSGSFATESCTVGTATGQRFVETRVNVAVRVRDTGCFATLVNGFTYIPDDTSCQAGPIARVASFTFDGIDTLTVVDDSEGALTIQVDFGDGTVLNGSPFGTFMHTYTTAGTFTVTLTATNALGSDTFSQTVTVTLTPTASFSFTLAGAVVTVTDASTGDPASLEWDFGDASGTQAGTPGESRSHTYAGPGSYTISLTATNVAGSDTTTNVVVVP